MNEKQVAQQIYDHYIGIFTDLISQDLLTDKDKSISEKAKKATYEHIDGFIKELYSLNKFSPTAITERIRFYEGVKKQVDLI